MSFSFSDNHLGASFLQFTSSAQPQNRNASCVILSSVEPFFLIEIISDLTDTAPLPAESDNESVADRETTPKATPKSTSKAKAAAEAEDTVMAEPGTKGEEEADEEEDSSDGDEE